MTPLNTTYESSLINAAHTGITLSADRTAIVIKLADVGPGLDNGSINLRGNNHDILALNNQDDPLPRLLFRALAQLTGGKKGFSALAITSSLSNFYRYMAAGEWSERDFIYQRTPHSNYDIPRIEPFVTLPIPENISPEDAVLGVQLAFFLSMSAGIYGTTSCAAGHELAEKDHPALSAQAQSALLAFFS